MGDMADGHGALLLDVAQEWALIIRHKVEDTVVIRDSEGDGVDALVLGGGALLWLKLQTMEGRQHAELELQLILIWDLEVPPAIPDPLGQRDGVRL